MVKPINVFCVYWGNKFPTYYVDILYSMIKRNLTVPFDFTLFTDQPERFDNYSVVELPDDLYYWWAKLAIYDTPDLDGTCLYFDLDVVIKDNIDCLLGYEPEAEFIGLLDKGCYEGPEMGLNSSLLRFEANEYKYILDTYRQGIKEGWLVREGNGLRCNKEGGRWREFYSGDQVWLNTMVYPTITDTWPLDWIGWYRSFLRGNGPDTAKIIIFHGRGKPENFKTHPEVQQNWK